MPKTKKKQKEPDFVLSDDEKELIKYLRTKGIQSTKTFRLFLYQVHRTSLAELDIREWGEFIYASALRKAEKVKSLVKEATKDAESQ